MAGEMEERPASLRLISSPVMQTWHSLFTTTKERKGKERKGKERKGKERKGKERKGKERKGKERKTGYAGGQS